MYEHLKPLITKLLTLKVEKLPSPWQLKTTISVGGLCSVGFDRAYGFSYTGQSFMIATSSDLIIYNRFDKL